ncbi:hypothetical protein F4818DRAFT_444167 [Hypoxylon cercidicola]|nr:hypothetical protein F4818DRAFT_444167 [Hypoxylon cercidicola]
MAAVNTESQELPIWVGFKGNNQPLVFDLSGAASFELYLNIRRSAEVEADSRDLVLLKVGSVFDFPAALDKGLVELVDEASGEVVRRPRSDTNQAQAEQVTSITVNSESFITLPTDVQHRDRAIKTVSLNAAPCLCALVRPELKYHLRLRDKYLGVRWWAWGSPHELCKNSSELPPSERKTLVSCGPLRSKTFTVVSEIPKPPKISINLSLEEAHASEGEDGAESEASSPAIHITITNTSSQHIILKTIGDQPHLTSPGEISNPRARVTADCPSVQNFSIVDQETQEDIISHATLFITPLAGGSGRGWPRKQFLALAPHERVIRTAKLPGHRLIPGREYHVGLRRTGCWWAYGTLDDLFGEGNAVFKRWPSTPTIPMTLESEDVVVLHH